MRHTPNAQIPFGRVVWTTLAGQLESVLDVSTVSKAIQTLWVAGAFTVGYYLLHNWAWRQILWLSLGAAKYVVHVANLTLLIL